jgi:trans-aconitate 2-methyltransferase
MSAPARVRVAPNHAEAVRMTRWDAGVYHRFAAERSAPFEDLVALVRVRRGMRAIDLGCGSGELTARLADALPDSDLLGLDSSAEMLAKARAFERRGLRFELGPIESAGGRWDLIFSNAALHWVDDHERLVSRLYEMLEPDGQLVAQLPAERRPEAYAAIVEVAGTEPFRSALEGWTQRWPVLSLERYAELLHERGASGVVAFEKIYPHVLDDADALAQWQSGTVLVAYRARLPASLHAAFDVALRERLRARWPRGPVFFPFRRMLLAATRPAREAGGHP